MVEFSKIGIMQGRLLPKYKGRYQAHPLGYWEDEFYLASKYSLSSIEFILDYDDSELNPLMSVEGLQKIKKIVDNTGVKVESVCADYFMESPLFRNRELSKSIETLIKLIKNVSFLGVNNIIIPCVDNSRFQSDSDKLEFIENMIQPLSYAQEYKVNLSLETDLNPLNFARLLDKFSSEYLTVNYDVGNSASLGYDSTEEFRAYGDRISDIHIKDRLLNGSSVLLGTGNTDFNKFFKLLEKLDYSGPLIMQAYRDDEGVDVFLSQYDWIKQRLAELYES